MKTPAEVARKSFFTPLGFLNFVLLQWLGIRLAKVVSCSVADKGDAVIDWRLLVGIVPLTGWWSNYIGPLLKWDITKRRHQAKGGSA